MNDGEIIYLQPLDRYSIKISKDEPNKDIEEVEERKLKDSIPIETNLEVSNIFLEIVKENKQLREENEELIRYKDRLEKYQNLEYIFEDEKFMEDWLERNIHKAVANLEIIDRQLIITWNSAFMRNKPDFFCLDKTTRELVIVENKVRGRHKKVETQFLTYSSWVKRNLEEINQKYSNRDLKATENFRFVIITDSSDERLGINL